MAIRKLFCETLVLWLLLRAVVFLEDRNRLVKTEYNPVMRKMVFIIPSKIRFFTPVSWFGALLTEIMFLCQTAELFLLNSEVHTWQYTVCRTALGFLLFLFTSVINIIEEAQDYIKYKEGKEKPYISNLVEAEKYNWERGKVIQQFCYNKTKSALKRGTVIILPFSHDTDINGDFWANGKRCERKQETRFGYVGEFDIYYDNIMAYDELADHLNIFGYDVIRFQFTGDSRNETIETFCSEVKSIVEELNVDNIVLLGHGVQGCMEAEILSACIKSSGLVLLCGAAVGILDSIRQEYINVCHEKFWMNLKQKKQQKHRLDSLEKSKKCDVCSHKDKCIGYCSKCVTPYFDSMRKYSGGDLKNIIRQYQKNLLVIYAKKALDYNAKWGTRIASLNSPNIRLEELEGVYETFRKPKGRDYRFYQEIYQIKEGDTREIDLDLVNILEDFLS